MEEDPTLTNILSITGAGLLIFISGLIFLIFRDFAARNIRYFLPLPPIAVAAYIYVFNLYQQNNGDLSSNLSNLTREIILSVGIISISFAAFTGLLILFINLFRKFL
jgi:hypothetical protein